MRLSLPARVSDQLAWARGLTFGLPRPLVERFGWSARVGADGSLQLSEDDRVTADAVRQVREYAAFTGSPPASARLPINYQRVPGPARAWIASIVGGMQRRRVDAWAAFPRWPLDLTADLFADLAREPRPAAGERTPVLLTHDLDSDEGVRSLVTEFLSLEEAVGARSTNYVVPCAWPLNEAQLDEIRARGHDLGVHGHDHANRTPFAAADERRRRLDAAQPFIDRHHARGYRAPSLLRTRELLRDLSTRYEYDSSVPTSGGLFPVPNSGCATARPFVLEGIVEIPVTLPRDGSLRFLRYSPEEILAVWIDCAETIARSGGVVVLLTHCEARFSGNPGMLGVYDRFLEYIRKAEDRFVFAMPTEVMSRFRARQI